MFNTSFIQNGNYIHAGKMELSPEDIRKDKGKILPNDFKVYIFFDDFCDKCNPYTTEINDLCQVCSTELGPQIIEEWKTCKRVIDQHSYPDMIEGQRLLPGVNHDEMRLLL